MVNNVENTDNKDNTCPLCWGRKKLYDAGLEYKCPKCNGTGVIKYEEIHFSGFQYDVWNYLG